MRFIEKLPMKGQGRTRKQFVESATGTSLEDKLACKTSLKQLQNLQSSILAAIPHAVVGIRDRTIFFANESAEWIFGWKPDELIGRSAEVVNQG